MEKISVQYNLFVTRLDEPRKSVGRASLLDPIFIYVESWKKKKKYRGNLYRDEIHPTNLTLGPRGCRGTHQESALSITLNYLCHYMYDFVPFVMIYFSKCDVSMQK